MSNIPVSVAVNPMPMPTSRSTTPAGGYPDEFYAAASATAAAPHDFNDLSQSEHYIYVTYPPELKRRLLERYGREIYLMLLKKDFHDWKQNKQINNNNSKTKIKSKQQT